MRCGRNSIKRFDLNFPQCARSGFHYSARSSLSLPVCGSILNIEFGLVGFELGIQLFSRTGMEWLHERNKERARASRRELKVGWVCTSVMCPVFGTPLLLPSSFRGMADVGFPLRYFLPNGNVHPQSQSPFTTFLANNNEKSWLSLNKKVERGIKERKKVCLFFYELRCS